jgi:hypothetical protein
VLGFRTVSFDALSFLGWVVFHGLDIAAVLVLAGCGWFLWRRFRHREADHRPALRLRLLPPDRPGRDLGHRPAAHLLQLAAGGPQLRLPGHRPHGHGGADAGVHPLRQVLPRHPAPGQRRGRDLQAGGPGARRGLPLPALRPAPGGQAFVADLKQTMDELGSASRSGPRPARAASGSSAARPTWRPVKRGFR